MDPEALKWLLEGALRLPGARLAVYQPRMLASFATRRLPDRVEAVASAGQAAWRIGTPDGHNLHVAPDAVREVSFEAEPWGCLEDRVNLAVWFLADHATGNPARMDGCFCVSLEDPYDAAGSPRGDRFAAVFELYQAAHGLAGVTASPRFLAEMERMTVQAGDRTPAA